jgi:hypothetical protein
MPPSTRDSQGGKTTCTSCEQFRVQGWFLAPSRLVDAGSGIERLRREGQSLPPSAGTTPKACLMPFNLPSMSSMIHFTMRMHPLARDIPPGLTRVPEGARSVQLRCICRRLDMDQVEFAAPAYSLFTSRPEAGRQELIIQMKGARRPQGCVQRPGCPLPKTLEKQMKLNQITLAALLMAVFSGPAVLAQGAGNSQPLSREAVQSEAISSHKDGTMVHGEVAQKSVPFKSTKTRKEVRAEAISSHKDGTMVHSEAAQKSEPFKSTRSRKEVTEEAIRSHKDGSMVHSEVTPVTPSR